MMRLLLCKLLLLSVSAQNETAITMEGDTVILDWAKCCDCEENPVKPMGQPCEVTITTAHKLNLKYTDSKWKHNIIEVPSKADFDTCVIPDSKMAIGQSADMPGVKTMDETMTYTEAGTFYYVCSVMCLESTGGPNDQYCHCGGFTHKLIVNVVTTTTTTTTSPIKGPVTTEGDTVILDWAKCCDCEENPIKPKGEPCEVTITTAHKLNLKYDSSKWSHNVIEVPSKADFDTCVIPDSKMAIGQTADMPGEKTMDETMTYTEAGTFYYVCSVMCTTSTGGPNDQYCHCGGFAHKLIVNVVPALASPLPDIVDTAVAAGSFTVLAAALTKANLVTTLKGTGPFTVFAPTDDAFAAALKKLGLTQEELLALPDLVRILTYHVVPGKVLSSSLTNGMTAITSNGNMVSITIGNSVVKVNTATVATADVMCSNGVIHIIDEVLVPPDPVPQPAPEPEPEPKPEPEPEPSPSPAPEPEPKPEPEPSPSPSPADVETSAAHDSQRVACLVFGSMLSAFFFA